MHYSTLNTQVSAEADPRPAGHHTCQKSSNYSIIRGQKCSILFRFVPFADRRCVGEAVAIGISSPIHNLHPLEIGDNRLAKHIGFEIEHPPGLPALERCERQRGGDQCDFKLVAAN